MLSAEIFTQPAKAKKKLISRFSGHFWQKQMRQAGFFFFCFFTHETGEGTFFYYTNPLKGLVS